MLYSREQTTQSSSQKHNIISGINGSRKGRFIGIEVCEDMREDGGRFVRGREFDRRFFRSVEFEQRWEERQDECE